MNCFVRIFIIVCFYRPANCCQEVIISSLNLEFSSLNLEFMIFVVLFVLKMLHCICVVFVVPLIGENGKIMIWEKNKALREWTIYIIDQTITTRLCWMITWFMNHSSSGLFIGEINAHSKGPLKCLKLKADEKTLGDEFIIERFNHECDIWISNLLVKMMDFVIEMMNSVLKCCI